MQAAKIRGLGRLLEILFFSGFFFFHPELMANVQYYWRVDASGPHYATAESACSAAVSDLNSSGGNFSYSSPSVVLSSESHGRCNYTRTNNNTGAAVQNYKTVSRYSTTCPVGEIYNPDTQDCSVPAPCSSKPPVYSAQSCTYIESLKVFSCPTSLSYQGCEYASAGGNNCDLATGICTGKWAPTGDSASPDGEPCTDTTCAPVPTPNPDPGTGGGSSDFDMCLTGTDGKTYCINDPDTGCGTYNGASGCPQPNQNCRSHNGEWICSDPAKDNRNCSYVKGEQVCINPQNPTQTIPADSPDHPKNGGNADGNPNNDPMAPGSSSGTPSASNPQGSNQAATNETVKTLGDNLGGKLDKGNGLLGDILGVLKGIRGAMSGSGDSDDGGDGNGDCKDPSAGCDSGEDGNGVGEGTDLAAMIGDKGAELLEDRELESKDYLDALPEAIANLFGEDGEGVGLGSDTLKELFPSHSSCTDLTIPLNFMGKSFSIVIPVCELSRVKPLLEWLIWCITLVGLWNILYTGLRQENAKAVKGGF